MNRYRRSTVLIVLMFATAAVFVASWFLRRGVRVDSNGTQKAIPELAIPTDDPSLRLGLQVYAEKCAPCHGATGRGDGPAAYLLYPKARNFSSGQFRLTSTESGLPSDADLLGTLKRGMPGSSMPPWGHLPDTVLLSLVSAVRVIAVEGRVATLMESGTMTREEALTIAQDVLKPGPPAEVPARPATGTDLSAGRQLYKTVCVPCHDIDGRGLLKRDLKDDDGYPIFARDFTQGIFKGGSEPELLALRIVRGLPGSPMPGMPYSAEDLWSLVDYIGTLVEPGAQARAAQSQQVLTPSVSDDAIPRDPNGERWRQAGSTYLPVTPLWWRNDRIEGVNVSMLRNLEEIGLRLEWNDSTADIQQMSQKSFSDGVAIQFSNADDPPSFTMGSTGRECDIWYWRASTDPLTAEASPHAGNNHSTPLDDHQLSEAIANDPVFLTATAAGNPVAPIAHAPSIQNLQAGGFGTLSPDGPRDQIIEGAAQRTSTGWAVVFVRRLQPTNPSDMVFDPSRPMHVGFAVWDGHNQDRNGQKSISIWHKLAW